MKPIHTIIGLLFLFSTSTAWGVSLTPTSQARSISVEANAAIFTGPFDSQSASDAATDFGLFDSSLSVNANVSDSESSASSSADSSQVSLIGATQISADGAASATAVALLPEFGDDANANSLSAFDVSFSLSESANYALTGMLGMTFTDLDELSSVSLSGPGGSLFTVDSTTSGGPFSNAGSLAAGTYSLNASAMVNAWDATPSGSASYQFTFDVTPIPLPAALPLLLSGLITLVGSQRIFRRRKK